MAKTTSDPKVVAGLIEAAADLKEQAGELPPPISIKPPTYRPILLALQLGKNRRTVESSPQAEMREQSVRDVLVPPLGTGVFSYAAAPPRQGVKPIRRNDVEAMGPAQKCRRMSSMVELVVAIVAFVSASILLAHAIEAYRA
jgi:hypothetical protein